MTQIRFDRALLEPSLKDTNLWPTVSTSLLSEKDVTRYKRREDAIQEYLSGKSVNEITKTFEISRDELGRLSQRCLNIHSDGRIWGWRALIPYRRQKPYERTVPVKAYPSNRKGGCSGALTQLFNRLYHIRELVDALFLKKRLEGIIHESRIPLRSIHKRFLDACRAAGVSAKDYPFTSKSLGRVALWKYLRGLLDRELTAGVLARHGKDAARILGASSSTHSEEQIVRPYQKVQFDGHRIDLFCTISMPSPYGGFVQRVIDRFWILAIIESASRAILGYYISLNREYNADDVLVCVRNAITPWKRRGLTIPGLKYPEQGGIPSEVIPELAWALWEEFSYDNAKANLAKKVLTKLSSIVGCATNAGPVKTPERRPFIERFFQTLEENGFHRLPSTTGSGHTDSRRDDPEQAAIRLDIKLEHIEELVEVLILQYNGTPHSGIGYRTPLEYLQYFVSDESHLIKTLPVEKRANTNLLNFEATRIVRGNIKQGRRPYIQFEGTRYQNDVLARTPDLIGKRLTLIVNPDDTRSLVAYLPDGSELGALTAHGHWGRIPHTLEVRKAILALRQKRLLCYTAEQDPVQVYLDYLANQSSGSKTATRQFAKAQRMPKVVGNRAARSVEPEVDEPEENQPQITRKTFTF
jgi:putative transposase